MTIMTKEEWKAYRANWKKEYKEISKKIRLYKNSFKPYLYEYREKGNMTSKKRRIIGDNPNYAKYQEYYRLGYHMLDIRATQMLQELASHKEDYRCYKEESDQNASIETA